MYLDRLDFYRVERTDQEIMSAITNTLGPRIWRNTIIGLSHGKAVAPRGSTQGILQTRTVIVNSIVHTVYSGFSAAVAVLMLAICQAALCSRRMAEKSCVQCIFAFVHVILSEQSASLLRNAQQTLLVINCYSNSCTVYRSVRQSVSHQLI